MSVLKENQCYNLAKIVFPVTGWGNSLLKIPKITDETVEKFYKSRTASSKHYKRSYNFLTESYIEAHSVKTIDDAKRGFVFIKGKCFKSQKKNDNPYTVIAAVNTDGEVADSSCSCPVGLGGFCNHLVALLRLVVVFKANNYNEPPQQLTCTELPQQWNRPRSTSLQPTSIMEIDWCRPVEGSTSGPMVCKLFQPRKKPRTENEISLAVKRLSSALRDDGLEILPQILEDGLSSPWIDTKLGKTPLGSTMSYQLCFDECGSSVLTNIPKYTHEHRSFHLPETDFKCPAFEDTQAVWSTQKAHFPLSEMQWNVFQKVTVDTEEAVLLEEKSRHQAESDIWGQSRKWRLTASRYGLVCNRVQKWNKVGIRNLAITKNLDHLPAIKYGRKFEALAATKYEKTMFALGHSVKIINCGLVVNAKKPWLGASPDRIVLDPTENPTVGLAEFKCPYSYRDQSPIEACNDPHFYVKQEDDKPSLKNKNYIDQVQGQLGISGFKWCDFVVFFKSGLIIQRIHFDECHWNMMVVKLDSFYFEEMLPFLSECFESDI